MTRDETTDILNELLACLTNSILPRLRESSSIVSWASADELRVLDRMIDEDAEHRQWLVQAIRDLGGDPLPVTPDIESMNMHYLELAYLLPRIVRDRKRLYDYCKITATQTGSNPRAATVIGRIMDRIRRHVEQLERLAARATTTPA